PVVTTNPVTQTISASHSVTFTAAATGTPAPTVQWQVSTDNGATFNNIPGATSTTLAFTALASQDGYQYRAVFTNNCGVTPNTAATLHVTSKPTVTTNPASGYACANTSVTYTAAATGTPTPTVQWQG